jgi:hypothetical protein
MGSSVLHIALLLKGSGFVEELEISDKWLDGLLDSGGMSSDHDRRSFALVALAMGNVECAMRSIQAKSTPGPWCPNRTFEFNIFEMTRYFAAALSDQVDVDDVRPAYNEFVETFPIHLAAKASNFLDLFNLPMLLRVSKEATLAERTLFSTRR